MPRVWPGCGTDRFKAAGKTTSLGTVIDLGTVEYMDMAGATFISRLQRLVQEGGNPQPDCILGLKEEFRPLLELAEKSGPGSLSPPPSVSYVEQTGENLVSALADAKVFISMIGEITWALGGCIKNPGRIRWADTWMVAERLRGECPPHCRLDLLYCGAGHGVSSCYSHENVRG